MSHIKLRHVNDRWTGLIQVRRGVVFVKGERSASNRRSQRPASETWRSRHT